MDRARKRVQELGQAFDRVGAKIRNFGAGISVGVTAPLVLLAKRSVDAWNTQVDAIAQVEAALKSTAGVSGQTSEGLQKMAADLQQVTTFGDEAMLAMQAVLLTFTNIRGDRFEQATTAILDMSAALGTSLQSAAHPGRQGAERSAEGRLGARRGRHPVHRAAARPDQGHGRDGRRRRRSGDSS